MNKEQIKAEFDAFFEFPTADKTQVSSVSCKLFAKVIADMTLSKSEPDVSLLGSLAKNWTEDSSHENGNYTNKCGTCSSMFLGHKRRVTCKECVVVSEPVQVSQEKITQAHYLDRLQTLNAENDALKDELKDSDESLKAVENAIGGISYFGNYAEIILQIKAENEALRQRVTELNKILEGLPQDAIDGGWTAKGISKCLKNAELERDSLRQRVAELESRLMMFDADFSYSVLDEIKIVRQANAHFEADRDRLQSECEALRKFLGDEAIKSMREQAK